MTKINFTALFFLIFNLISAQKENFRISDSLKRNSYEELEVKFVSNIEDSVKAEIYASTILKLGVENRDTLNILKGYSFLAFINEKKQVYLQYSDSIIELGTKAKNSKYLALGFLNKADYYFDKKQFEKSLDNYLFAQKFNKNSKRIDLIINQNIGILKSRLGQDREALEMFRHTWQQVNDDYYRKNDPDTYLNVLFSLSANYSKLKVYDSAIFYTNKGLKESLILDKKSKYFDFLLMHSVNDVRMEKYLKAQDSILKVIKHKDLINNSNKMVAYYYYGEILSKLKKRDSAINQFIKVDSLFSIERHILPELRKTYEHLITYYRKKDNKEKQLEYIEKLIKIDSLLSKDYKYLVNKITKEYDTPKLLSAKENTINKLKNKNKIGNIGLGILISISLLMAFTSYYFYRRQGILKRRFESLIKNTNNKGSDHKAVEKIKKPIPDHTKDIGIPDEVVNTILKDLETFENKLKFIEKQITIVKLSGELNTNPNYLSKIINSYKGKNFSNYINDLRIEFCIERLKRDKKFRKYTVKAISREVGFNTNEAFSKAFYKKTGLYPSYFIKRYEELDN